MRIYPLALVQFKWITSALLFFLPQCSFSATRLTTFQNQFWTAYIAQYRITSKIGLWLDVHARMRDDATPNVTILRPGISYFLNDNIRIMAGVASVQFYPYAPNHTITQEIRPWYQVWWRTVHGPAAFTHHLRHELRYVQRINNDRFTGDYMHSHRVRYSLYLQLALNKPTIGHQTIFLALHDELFINTSKNIAVNVFDQNRFFVGLGYVLRPNTQIQLGYLHVLVQQPTPYQFLEIHAPRIFLFHNLDFRKPIATTN